MKDFDKQSSQDNKVIAAEQRHVKSATHTGRMKLHPGHTLYSFNLDDGTIAEVPIVAATASFEGGVNKKVQQLPNHLYAGALNKQNALRKFIKMYDRLVREGKIQRPQQG